MYHGSVTFGDTALESARNSPTVRIIRGWCTLHETARSCANRIYPNYSRANKSFSGDTTPCKVTPVILNGVASPGTLKYG